VASTGPFTGHASAKYSEFLFNGQRALTVPPHASAGKFDIAPRSYYDYNSGAQTGIWQGQITGIGYRGVHAS
jgi:hypothetical protein